MDVSRLFRRGALSVSWRRETKGVIWRIVPDLDGGLILEERDPAARTASYCRVLVRSGQCVWENVVAPGGWWSGIECITGGVLLIHGFATPDLPGHRGLTALDLRTGASLWCDEEVVFVAAAEGVAYGLRRTRGGREVVGRELLTGAVTGVGAADESHVLDLMTRWQAESPPVFRTPDTVAEGTAEHERVRRLFRGGRMVEGVFEVSRVDDALVVAHHESAPPDARGQPGLRRVLSVFIGAAARPVYRAILDERLTMPVPESFLLIDRTVLFVQGRRALCALRLGGAEGRG